MIAKAAAVLTLILTGCVSAHRSPSTVAVPPASVPKRAGFSEVNGLKMYYEIHGPEQGVPVVLIHGGGSSIDVTWSQVLPILSRHRQVIAIDEQAHGRSGDRPAPVRFEQTADDVAALLARMEIEKADVMGFSNGASTALQMAIRHAPKVRKLVFISSFTKRSGAAPGFFAFMQKAGFADMPQNLKDAYLTINPDPAALRNMHDKDAARMRGFKDLPDKDVRALKLPTLIVLGDQDVVTTEHALAMQKMIAGSRLLILPGGHGDFLGKLSSAEKASPVPGLTTGLINEFLGAP